MFGTVDRRMGQLPGLQGFNVCSKYADKLQTMLPADARVHRDPIQAGPDQRYEEISVAS